MVMLKNLQVWLWDLQLTTQNKRGLMKKGFTLVELLIVLAVIALMASVLIPNYMQIYKKIVDIINSLKGKI